MFKGLEYFIKQVGRSVNRATFNNDGRLCGVPDGGELDELYKAGIITKEELEALRDAPLIAEDEEK
ncbi:MAG: hypothetical protein UH542_01865 [Bacteroidales bacterium]|nr:hypothetical protein [Bacteroidales bacterium]MEE0991706.1 hypothetical protein [Bacteroidales bacterium]